MELYGKEINMESDYYVVYADECIKNEGNKTGNYEEYYKLINMPNNQYVYDAIDKLPPEKNPHITVLKGSKLAEILHTKQYIPLYDKFFELSHRLVLLPADALHVYNFLKYVKGIS
jgi:hypothetical protein